MMEMTSLSTNLVPVRARPSVGVPARHTPKRGILRATGLVRAAALAVLLVLLSPVVWAQQKDEAKPEERVLSFYNTHTDEHLSVVYRRGKDYVPEALDRINYILRDHFTGDVYPIDPHLLDFLYDLLQKVNYHKEVHIVCGFRSVKTNTMLHNRTTGVVLGSQHTKGRAMDIRLPGVDTKKLYEVAKAMKRGGTGYYKSSDFIQIDTGPVRCW
jgi:uncharacterized protein YcbK (DUF882 family)